MSRAKELTRNTFIITLGRVSTQFISFLLLPLYTALLTTEEYGTVDLITTLVQLLIPIMSIMIDQGAFRYLLNCVTEDDKKRTITSAFAVLICTSGICLFIYGIASVFVANPYKIWLLLILIATAFSHLFLQIARGLKHTGDYALGSFVCSVSTIALNVLCIAFLKMGAVGMLIATFLGNLACSLFLFCKLGIFKYIGIKYIDKGVAKDELKYSSPLVPNQLSLWVMNSSDRLIVSFILGTAANGILAVSHKFPTIYMTFFNVFQLAWHETGAIHYFDEDRDEFFSGMIHKLVAIFSTLCMCVLVALPLVFNILVRGSFSDAYYNIPIYLVAFLFNVVVGILGVVYVATKKTAEIAKTTMLAAAINFVVHIALINYIGLFAASISTFVGYLVTMVYRIIDTKKYLKIKYNVGQFSIIGAALALCTYIYYLRNMIVSLVFLPFFIAFVLLFNRQIVKDAWSLLNDKIGSKIGKNKLIGLVIAIFVAMFALGGLYIWNKTKDKTADIQNSYKGEIIQVTPDRTVLFEEFGADNFTCTGLTYDPIDDCFWIADYGAIEKGDAVEPRIVSVDAGFTNVVDSIDLTNISFEDINLQGIAFDTLRNEIWAAIGEHIIRLNKNGEVTSSFKLDSAIKCNANGICYDEEEDCLWVLCAAQYLLKCDVQGKVINQYKFNYSAQDHIAICNGKLFITVGDDYSGDYNYLCVVSTNGEIEGLYQIEGSNAIEGVTCYKGRILISNDGYYHSDKVGKSYICVYAIKDFQ